MAQANYRKTWYKLLPLGRSKCWWSWVTEMFLKTNIIIVESRKNYLHKQTKTTTWKNFTRSRPHNIVLYILHNEPSNLVITIIKTPEGAANFLIFKPIISTSTFMTVFQWESMAHFCRFQFWHYWNLSCIYHLIRT